MEKRAISASGVALFLWQSGCINSGNIFCFRKVIPNSAFMTFQGNRTLATSKVLIDKYIEA